jgi:long-chain acyl-CoA synthetase
VVGVPDEIFGEAVAAFIEMRAGQTLTKAEVAEHTKSRIASYKKPKYVYFVDALPRNALGKILKNELREIAVTKVKTEEAA